MVPDLGRATDATDKFSTEDAAVLEDLSFFDLAPGMQHC